jgi:amino acid adenylation domain-containing protein
MNDPDSQIANLSPAKRALLELKLGRRQRPAGEETISNRGHRESFPLSSGQHQLWFLCQMEPENPFYNVSSGMRINAPRLQALESALTAIVARHDLLRATFKFVDGKPVHVVGPALGWKLPLVDLSGLQETERKSEAQRLSIESACRPFDLDRGPLLSTLLIRSDATLHELIVTVHHIVSDAWSLGVMWRETILLCETLSAGRPSPLSDLPIQYSDFVLWQRDRLDAPRLSAQVGYWTRQLADVDQPLPLPLDRPRPPRQSFRGNIQTTHLSGALSAQIKRLCREEGVTLFVVLLAGFKLLLHRYTGRTDICVGSPFANRDRTELQGLVGFLISTLVLRTRSGDDPSFRELIERVRNTMLGAYAHSDLPIENLIETLRVPRELAYNPLFQVMFSLQNAAPAPLRLFDQDLATFEIHNGHSKFDLTLEVRETPDGLVAEIESSADLFDRTTIARMLRNYEALLESVVANAEQRVSHIALLPEPERQQVLVEWSEPEIGEVAHASVHELFQRQVELAPDAVTLVDGSQTLTHAALDRRANRLAYRLRSVGVCPEDRVAVYLKRSADFVVSLLAVLKAGAAYLPLDPAYPMERLVFMMKDAGVSATITEPSLLKALRLEREPNVLLVDEPGESPEVDPGNLISPRLSPQQLAYVVYTSGSTGEPKGVQVTHGGLSNLVSWHRVTFGVTREDRATQVASLSFDACGWELWPYLSAGAPVYLADEETRISAPRLGDWLSCVGATISFLPTPLAESVLAAQRSDESAALRLLLVGGDKLQRVPPIKQHQTLVNNYGPTESTVVATSGNAQARDDGRAPSIGRAITNSRIYLLDDRLQPVPLGAPAEIYIGGNGLARGYLGRVDATADRFMPDPFNEAGSRMYRTGDTGRYSVEGNIEFLGRTDRQVKVRGFRIELGEIEAALEQHPSIAEGVVVTRENRAGDTRLAAYVVFKEGVEVVDGALRKYLRTKLPEYMVPAQIVKIDALPLTPNGKVDRRALPAPVDVEKEQVDETGGVNTVTEELLMGVWGEILSARGLTRESNFFEVGGHSLLATQLLSRIAETFRVELALRSIFDAPTVAALAEGIDSELRAGKEWRAPSIERVSRDGPLPVSHAQERLWFLEQLEGGQGIYNCPVSVNVKGKFRIETLEQAVSEVMLRHEGLRATFSSDDGRPVQVIKEWQHETVQIVDMSELVGAVGVLAERLVTEAARSLFDLRKGPLLRVAVMKLAEEEHVLAITVHHIASDGWSQWLLFKELTQAYDALEGGRPLDLEELPVQYADYAAWQRNWMSGDVLEAQLRYWKNRIGGAPPVMDLATDRPRPAEQTFVGARKSMKLPGGLSAKLRELSLREGTTLFMTLLAGFKVLLSKYTGREQIVVGTPIAGRSRAEIERLIGFFVNTLVLRTRIGMDGSFRETLREIREGVLEAHANQDLPFEKLVEEIKPERSLSHHPLFQVMFTQQNRRSEELKFGEAETSYEDVETGVAKFDLTLGVSGNGEELEAVIEYNVGLFDATSIRRMLGHYIVLLEGAAGKVEGRLSELTLLGEAERHQILREWNETQTGGSKTECIHEVLGAQAERTPDRIAVVYGEEELSYEGLNRRANQLAGRLRAMGVGPEVLVGVWMDRCVEMVVGMIAILKAGGGYLALDPGYPDERLGFVLEDAEARVVLTQRRFESRISGKEVRTLCVDESSERENGEGEASPENQTSGGNLAYVIYTSGSTGRPKGVAIEHRSAVTMLNWAREVFDEEELSRVLASTSICFDLSVFELFVPLSMGGEVILVENGLEPYEEYEVTLINTVPSVIKELLRFGALPETVQTVNLAGEALSRELVGQICLQRAVKDIYNLYGPSEDTTYSSWARVNEYVESAPPIGRPIADTEIYVLDRDEEPVSGGMAGEIHIGGEGLARGYKGQPELTAEKFIPNPFGDGAGKRMYATGDTGRYQRDGRIQFVGRKDQQVKVRGFRIELGEIETIMRQDSRVREAVVVVREDKGGDKRVVGYVVGKGKEVLEVREIRNYMRSRLPEYMVPGEFVVLDELPLTPNGKVDRKALRAAAALSVRKASIPGQAKTVTELLLSSIWCDVLGTGQVERDTSFFEMGGHSLLAMQLVSRMHEMFKVEVALRSIFESPTVASLAKRIDRELRAGGELETPAIERVRRDGELPLSFAQERLWFFGQLEGGKGIYNCPTAVRVKGEFSGETLEQTVREVIRRQESLRTVFPAEGGRPVQVITRLEQTVEHALVHIVDLSGLDRRDKEEALLTEAGRRPFDLGQGPLIRTLMLKNDEDEHVIVITMHHIVSDGWSESVLLKELSDLYGAFNAGRPSGLNELSIQYADYAAWQRWWLQGEVLEAQLRYWRKRIDGAPPVMELATDRPRPAAQNHVGDRESMKLPAPLCEKLKGASLLQGTTLFMTLLAGFKVLLSKYTGGDDIVVGTPISGRTRVDLEDVIGFFVNTLVLRTRIGMDGSFRETLREIREGVLEAHANQDLPFEKLVEEIKPERSLSHHPLFQVMFTQQNRRSEELKFGEAETSYEDVETGVAKFDLTLGVSGNGEELEAVIEYNVGLFDATSIRRMLGHYIVLLEGAAGKVEGRLSELTLLGEAERHQILREWNETQTGGSKTECIHEVLGAQAERTPDRIAVVYGEEELSYEGLNRRANQLAGRLRAMGVGPEVLVGVWMDRCVEMVVGMIAILKAGGGYLALDPGYPDERLGFVLEDAEARVVLTQRRFESRISGKEVRTLCVDESSERENGEGEASPENQTSGGNLAYVIYTSGSTGRPKGVAIEHRSAVTMLNWAREVFDEEELSRVLASTSICFDLSVFELFVPLSMGGEVILVENGLEPYEEYEVTLINTVPSVIKELLRFGALPETVQTVNLAGEALSRELVGQICLQRAVKDIYNLYGPSEDTTYSSWARVNEYVESAPPIGRPIADTEIYVLDRDEEPVSGGMAGEIHIGGEGLARGYKGQPELTAEKFIPNPFGDGAGKRMYATGDTGRYQRDGRIQFVGRKDQQVKVRGFRIELGEIETIMRQDSRVREAVVVVREDKGGDKRVVGYVVGKGKEVLEVREIRNYMRSRLPEYMVPGEFVVLDELPLTPNGKVDRKALPLPGSVRSPDIIAAPETPTQELLVKIWAEMLYLGEVSVQDNFFHLGGHSLLATQLVSRIRDAFKIELPLRTVFEEPTVAELARRIDEEGGGSEHLRPPAIEAATAPAERGELSFSQQRMWYLDQVEPGNFAYNIPLSLRLFGELNPVAIEQSISSIVRRHSILRTRFRSIHGEPAQVVDAIGRVALPLIEIDLLPESRREALAGELARAEARRAFDLASGPLLRSTLVRLNSSEHLLLLTIHHIISDGWSMGIVFTELADLYNAFAEGRRSTLPELQIQYSDFALWQREWLMGGALERQLAYWREQLRDVPSVLTIPGDRPRPAAQTYAGAYESVELTEDLSRKIEAMSKREGVTIFVTLLTAFKALIFRYTGHTDIVVGTSIANRNQTQTESLIGFFVNTLVLRTNCDGDPPLTELLRRVRETALGAYDHQDVPFERLIEELRPERDVRFSPIFQLAFEFQNSPARMPKLPGIRAVPMSIDPGASHFDLTLGVANEGERLGATIEYNTDLFDAATIARLLKDYRALLESAVGEIDQRLSTWVSAMTTELRSGLDSDLRTSESVASSASLEKEVTLRRARLAARRAKLSSEKLGLLDSQLRGE